MLRRHKLPQEVNGVIWSGINPAAVYSHWPSAVATVLVLIVSSASKLENASSSSAAASLEQESSRISQTNTAIVSKIKASLSSQCLQLSVLLQHSVSADCVIIWYYTELSPGLKNVMWWIIIHISSNMVYCVIVYTHLAFLVGGDYRLDLLAKMRPCTWSRWPAYSVALWSASTCLAVFMAKCKPL